MSLDTTAQPEALPATPIPEATLLALDPWLIVRNPRNPRKKFDQAKLEELAVDFKAIGGNHTPVLVRKLPADRMQETFADRQPGDPLPTHELVFGERRWRASALSGTKVLATMRELTDAQAFALAMTENVQRESLLPLEEAEGFREWRNEHGVTVAYIAETVGRSVRYVNNAMSLLKLSDQVSEALDSGAIDVSRAHAIATIVGDKLQAKALEYAITVPYGLQQPPSVRQLQTWIAQNCRLGLAGARFDIKDVTLRDDCGACGDCPKRTGADADLVPEHDGPDMCLDPACFHDKEQTHDERALAAKAAAGGKVIQGEKAEQLVVTKGGYVHDIPPGFVDLDAPPPYELGLATSPLRRALGKLCPASTSFMHPETKVVSEIVRLDRVKQIVKEHCLSRHARKEAKQAQEAKKAGPVPIEKRPEYGERWEKLAMELIDKGLQAWQGDITGLLRAYLGDRARYHYTADQVGEALLMPERSPTSQAVVKRLNAVDDIAIPQAFGRWVMRDAMDNDDPFDSESLALQGPRSTVGELLHMTGVDLAEVQAQVRRDIESEDRAKALEAEAAADAEKTPAAKAPAAPAKGGGGKANGQKAKPSPAARAQKAATTVDEAVSNIAAGLRALDSGTEQGAADAAQGEGHEGAAEVPSAAHLSAVQAIAQLRADSGLAEAPAADAAAAPPAPTNTGGDEFAHLTPQSAWPFPPKGTSKGAPAQTPAPAPAAGHVFAIGDPVRISPDLENGEGIRSKVAGRHGFIESQIDGKWRVKFGPRASDMTVLAEADIEHASAAQATTATAKPLRSAADLNALVITLKAESLKKGKDHMASLPNGTPVLVNFLVGGFNKAFAGNRGELRGRQGSEAYLVEMRSAKGAKLPVRSFHFSELDLLGEKMTAAGQIGLQVGFVAGQQVTVSEDIAQTDPARAKFAGVQGEIVSIAKGAYTVQFPKKAGKPSGKHAFKADELQAVMA